MYPLYIFISFIISLISLSVTYFLSKSIKSYKETVAKIFVLATIVMILGKGFFNNAHVFSFYLGACIALCFVARFVTKRSKKDLDAKLKEDDENACKVKYPD